MSDKDFVSHWGVVLPIPLKPILGLWSISLHSLSWEFLIASPSCWRKLCATQHLQQRTLPSLPRFWEPFTCREFYCILKNLSPLYLNCCTPKLNRTVWGTFSNSTRLTLSWHVGQHCVYMSEGQALQQTYHIWSALAAVWDLGKAGHISLPQAYDLLAQQNSICLINLDSFVGVTVLYSAAMFKDIFGVLGTRWLSVKVKKASLHLNPFSSTNVYVGHCKETKPVFY